MTLKKRLLFVAACLFIGPCGYLLLALCLARKIEEWENKADGRTDGVSELAEAINWCLKNCK